jgi:hypothetical protein
MDRREALDCLEDGHSVLSEETAREVCEVLGVSFPEDEVMQWAGQADAYRRYGFVPFEDEPGAGMGNLELSYHVARALGLGAPGSAYGGKGFQARANVQAIRQRLAQ